MKLISGDVPERFIGADCKSADPSGLVGSNPTVAAIFAARAEALTSAPAFNHTAEAEWLATELYASRCVSQKGAQQWTNNKKENKEDL